MTVQYELGDWPETDKPVLKEGKNKNEATDKAYELWRQGAEVPHTYELKVLGEIEVPEIIEPTLIEPTLIEANEPKVNENGPQENTVPGFRRSNPLVHQWMAGSRYCVRRPGGWLIGVHSGRTTIISRRDLLKQKPK